MIKHCWIILYLLGISSSFAQKAMSADSEDNQLFRVKSEKYTQEPLPENGIILLENSMTANWKIVDPDFFVNKHYITHSISGQNTTQILMRFRQNIIGLKPKLVVIMGELDEIAMNTNPASVETRFSNITALAELAQAHQIKVALCSLLPANIPWSQSTAPSTKALQINELLKWHAKKNNLVYIDFYRSMVDPRGGLDEKYMKNLVHINLLGYRVMAPLLEEGIATALAR